MDEQTTPHPASLQVAALAKARGLKIGTLANKAGITPKTAGQYWHNTRRGYTADVLGRLAHALDVTVPQLFLP